MIDVRSAIPPGGYLSSWLDYIAPFEFPDSYGLFALLAGASCAIDRRIRVNPDGEPDVYTNLYVVLLGPAGARKGAAMRRANRVLGNALPDAPVLPRTFTMEACTNRLVEDSADGGNGSGMIVAHELKRLIAGQDYNKANVDFLTDIWDCDDPFTRQTNKYGYQEIHRPYLVLQSGAQPDFLETLPSEDLTAGLLRRLLLINEYGPKLVSSNPYLDNKLFAALVEIFKRHLAPGAFGNVDMTLSDEAQEAKRTWYEGTVQQIWQTANEREGQFASCMEAHALKLAAIVQALETGRVTELHAESLRIGQRLVEAIIPELFKAYIGLASTPYARLRAALLRMATTTKGGIAPARLMQDVVNTLGVREREVGEALERLLYSGALRIVDSKIIPR